MISIITAGRSLSRLPSFIASEEQSMTSPISEVYNIMGESSACLRLVACVRITSTVEHHTVFGDRNGRIADCVVVRSQSLWKRRSAENTFDRLGTWQIAVG